MRRRGVFFVLLLLGLAACGALPLDETERQYPTPTHTLPPDSPLDGVEKQHPTPTHTPPHPLPLDEAEKRWQDAGVSDYRIQVREIHSTWCLYDAQVEVRGGQVISATVTAQLGPAQSCGLYVHGVIGEPVPIAPEEAQQWTVESLFETAHALEEKAKDDENLEITLEFDPELGYPVRLAWKNALAYDADQLIMVGGVQVLP